MADELGVSRTTVRRYARELGLRSRAVRREPSVETQVRPAIGWMIQEGLDDAIIAGRLDLDQAARFPIDPPRYPRFLT